MIKILHLSYSIITGGAAIACKRLNDEMCIAGMNSSILTADMLSPISKYSNILQRLLFRYKYYYYWKKNQPPYIKYKVKGAWNSGCSLNKLLDKSIIKDADVIYLHWICNNMLSIEEIGRLLDTGKLIVWFLHDMWPLTGGCHHSFECLRYQTHCGCCPMLSSTIEKDLSYNVFERKIKYLYNRKNLTIVSPSRWLANCAKRSFLFSKNRIEVIPNLLNTNIFIPIRKEVAREALGLPKDKKLILFGCDGGSKNFYKGWKFLKETLKLLDKTNIELVMFGGNEDPSLNNEFQQKAHYLGKLRDEISLCLAYCAADVFVSPSIAENFSLALCESSACETPVVCFDIGGNSDIVLHKMTGYLAKYKDANDLAKGIEWVINNTDLKSISIKAREHVISLCSIQKIINKHVELISSMSS